MGDYDQYIMLTERYHWTPEQIDELPLLYYKELVAFISAEHVVEQKRARKAKRS